MPELAVPLSPHVLGARDRSADEFVRELRFSAATQLYHAALISQERAAEVDGMSRIDFLDELARRQLDVFVVDFDDLDRELSRG